MTSCMGLVRSYGSQKGFGFISSDAVSGDVFFGRDKLPEDLRDVIAEKIFDLKGREVSFQLQQAESGKSQALSVTLVANEGEALPGKVKSYNGQKGYGFFTSSALEGQDIFFSKKDLPPELQFLANIPPGLPATFIVAQVPDGKAQAKSLQFASGLPVAAAPNVVQNNNWAAMQMQMMGSPMPMQSNVLAAPAPVHPIVKKPAVQVEGQQTHVLGVVKSYNDQKGFGFIASPVHPTDIYFKGEGGSFEKGSSLAFQLHITPEGKAQAKNICAGLQDGQPLVGTVRFYNPQKGFGFIRAPDAPVDVYFKGPNVPAAHQMENYTDQEFRFTVMFTTDGKPQAENLQLCGGGPVSQVVKRQHAPMAVMAAEAMMPVAKRPRATLPMPVAPTAASSSGSAFGTVKSYNPTKGYGFIECPALSGDVFLSKASLPLSHQNMALQGSQVTFSLVTTAEGKHQAQNVTLPF